MSGKVLIVGGGDSGGTALRSAEIYDPTLNTWSSAGNLATERLLHTATLLLSGKVLAAGGYNGSYLNTAELYLEDLGFDNARRPVITTVSNRVAPGSSLTLTGGGFTGDSEAAGGNTNSSATNYPLLQLRRIDNEQIVWTSPAAGSTRSATNYQSAPLPGVPRGAYLLTMIVNGIASNATMVIEMTLDIDDSAPNTQYGGATDGLLLMRYLLGLRGSALADGTIGVTARRDATQIAQYIAANLSSFDVDGDGLTLATTDGVMILRRLLGITSAAAITSGVKNSNRSDADVLTAIESLMP